MLQVTVNGIKTKVKAGRIIQGIRSAGVPVPTMCYHPDLAHSGGRCRVCMCTVNGRLTTPCNADLAEGMEIVTDTPELVQLRREALALIPKEGQTTDSEGKEAYAVYPDTIPLKTSSKYIRRRPELCTNCNLCVQMCQDTQGVTAIAPVRCYGLEEGSSQLQIRTFHDVHLQETECITCGQCINVCPTGALTEISEVDAVDEAMRDESLVKVVQFAPAVRVALAEEFGCAPGERILTHEMVSAARLLGKNVKVFDTNFAADLTIIEEGYELLERLRRTLTGTKKFGPGAAHSNSKSHEGSSAHDHFETALPMITSCSPGWINYCERAHPDLLPHLSSCKSPMEMAGALAKHVYPDIAKTSAKNICSIAVMPCVAKKSEKDRDQFQEAGVKDVDHVLTTREFAQLLRRHNVDPTKLMKSDFDDPFGIASGAALIFGASGGVMEAAIRTVYEVTTGREVPFRSINVMPVRGMEGVKEASVKLEHVLDDWKFLEGVEVKVAVAHGIANARKLAQRIRDCKEHGAPLPYHFVEVMACPGGCLGGGGQPKPTSMAIKAERAKLIYAADGELSLRKSHENPAVQQLYKKYLKEPLGELSHRLLHTTYRAVEPESHSLHSTAEYKQAVEALQSFPKNTKRNLTNIFSAIVDKFGCVSDASIVAIADWTGTTPVDIESILSHYHFFPRLEDDVVEGGTVGTSTNNNGTMVYLCDCTGCQAKGSRQVRMELLRKGIPFHLTNWLGWCVNGGPAALVRHKGDPSTHQLLNITEKDPRLDTIDTFKNPALAVDFAVSSMKRFAKNPSTDKICSVLEDIQLSKEDMEFLATKMQCPVSRKAFNMQPDAIIKELESSGIRGCGGAGFPAHFKWSSVRREPGPLKYVVVNADEGLPSTFKDYYLLNNPKTRMRMISGACIGAHTVGASAVVIYLRYEYRNLAEPIRQGFGRYMMLNPHMPRETKLEVVLGGGPYICGEETALFESLEGHLPQARSTRTVYPSHHGLYGQPTLVGNVESFAWVPTIVYNGGDAFRTANGQGFNRGMKLFSISGDVPKPTLAEFPLGIPLSSVLEECSGMRMDEVAAVEVGGELELLTSPADFDKPLTLDGAPGTLPAGGSIVIFSKEKFSPAKIYRRKALFAQNECCQLCAPCREGTKVFRHAVDDLISGKAMSVCDKLRLQDVFHAMEIGSNCGHGKGCGKLARSLLDAAKVQQ
jgi:NADP-reducing hydrogenase subunit HndD